MEVAATTTREISYHYGDKCWCKDEKCIQTNGFEIRQLTVPEATIQHGSLWRMVNCAKEANATLLSEMLVLEKYLNFETPLDFVTFATQFNCVALWANVLITSLRRAVLLQSLDSEQEQKFHPMDDDASFDENAPAVTQSQVENFGVILTGIRLNATALLSCGDEKSFTEDGATAASAFYFDELQLARKHIVIAMKTMVFRACD
eukprot:TRINITY_DN3051_c0_g1_i1.p4 TRINITY_DN3051_c0_g1~~TRINITY_DN3051_c0_g1_i1.p4  ORF type:complete len:204 (+),score=45.37 TRINITY_DN3051_c0_g1_i1:4447-5058(+)